ncbi:hypothetical protein QMP26_41880 (plasmid) [Enterocloster clostridioformis]
MLLSPYRIKENFEFKPSAAQKSISAGRLTKLFKNGQIGERSEAIIHFLYELQFLSGHLIQTCFHHPKVAPGLKKLRNDKKNPYHPEIQFLLNMGIVRQYEIISPYGSSISYVYGLTEGASAWSKERFYNDEIFVSFFNPEIEEKQNIPSYEKLLSLLSLNQFIISFQVNNWNNIADAKIDFKSPSAHFTSATGKILPVGSIRRFSLAKIELTDYMNHFYSGERGDPEIIILIVESMEAAADIHRNLLACKWPKYGNILYSRDYSSINLKNPLYGALGRFRDDLAMTFDLCTIEL